MSEHSGGYKCIKTSLKKFKREANYDKFYDAIYRTNRLVRSCYQLIRSYLLYQYTNNEQLTDITHDVISDGFRILCIPAARGRQRIETTEYLKFKNYCENIFLPKTQIKLENGVNLSSILDYQAESMCTCISNNIEVHFIDHLRHYINAIFIQPNKPKKEQRYELNKLKQALINGNLDCDKKYHQWINKNRKNILPTEYTKSYYYDIKVHPLKYLKYMIYMNIELENIGKHMLQFFPQRNSNIPKNITVDTKGLIELFGTNKGIQLKNIKIHQKGIWNKYFKCNKSGKSETNEFNFITLNGYEFDYLMTTDGYSVSLTFRKQTTEKKFGTKLKKDTMEQYKYIDELSEPELEQLSRSNKIYVDPGKRDLITALCDNGNIYHYSNRTYCKHTHRQYTNKRLCKFMKKRGITKLEEPLAKYNSRTCNYDKYLEFVRIKYNISKQVEELYNDEIFRKYKWYGYINRKREDAKLINKLDNAFMRKEIANLLNNTRYTKYQTTKNMIITELKKYIDDKQVIQQLDVSRTWKQMRHIVIQYERKNITIMYGDWSVTKQMRNFISTPNIRFKRHIGQYFKICDVDEFRTSMLNYKTEQVCQHLRLQFLDKKCNYHNDEMYSILTYKMENNRIGCINRDNNSVKNMYKIINHFLTYRAFPENFIRTTKIDEINKPLKITKQTTDIIRKMETKLTTYRQTRVPKTGSLSIQ